MIRVNLLPFRAARKKDNVKRQVSIYLFLFVLAIVGLIFFNFNLGSKTEQLNNRITVTEKELNTYKEINKEIDEIKKKLETLKAKTGVIAQLESGRREPVVMLDSMTELIVPRRMWFTSLKIREKIERQQTADKGKRGKKSKKMSPLAQVAPEKSIDLAISGVALDHKTIADFMVNLEESPLYKNVNLESIKQVNIRNVDLKEFIITFNKVPAQKLVENSEENAAKG